jgi:Undecaprenyl-phosphate glucose phosphotransferase
MKSIRTELFLYLLLDLFVLNYAFIATEQLIDISFNPYERSLYLLNANLSWVIAYLIYPKRNFFIRRQFLDPVTRITKRLLIFTAASLIIESVAFPEIYFRRFSLINLILFYTGEILVYWLIYLVMRYRRQIGLNTSRALIVGSNKTAHLLRKMIDSSPALGFRFVGFLSSKHLDHPHVVGQPEDLENIIDQYHAEIVFVTHSLFSYENRGKEFLRICNKKGIRLRYVTENKPWIRTKTNAQSFENLVIINPQYIPLDDTGLRLLKRIYDILFSLAVILFVFSWSFPIIALAIRLTSKGPVFFIQERTGINNKIFRCLKFRTMKLNDEANLKQATQHDSRVTEIGKIMRRTHLDELPQFFNVLAGQMSVVGPRPHMLRHTQYYAELIKYYLTRHYVKPGITGWAQVNGYHGETNELWLMQKRVEYDLEYIEQWSIGWDLKIIWMTVFGKYTMQNKRVEEKELVLQE